MKINFSLVLFTMLVMSSFQTQSFEDIVEFDNATQEADYKTLVKELRCPKCQNQNIADSNAVVAKDMRAKTLSLLQQGQNKDQVVEYMVNRYGQFAHYRPPINIATVMLWAVPLGFIIMCLVMLWRRSRVTPTVDENISELNDNLDVLLNDIENPVSPAEHSAKNNENQSQ